MAGEKLRGERKAIPEWKLDAVDRHDAIYRNELPSMTETLSKGSPAEVRKVLGGQGALLRAGQPGVTHVDVLRESLRALVDSVRGGDADEVREFIARRSADGELPPTVTRWLRAVLVVSQALGRCSPDTAGEFLTPSRDERAIPAPIAEWLGAALEAISGGADANLALRLSTGKRGRSLKLSARELADVERQIDDLMGQGVTRFDAMGIVERYRMALRHDDDPDALHGQGEPEQVWQEHEAASERLRKLLERSRQGTE